MIVGETKYIDYTLLDSLLNSELDFALFSLPGSEQLTMILQSENHAVCLNKFSDLDPAEGFVISPFDICSNNPIVLIRKDVELNGEDKIFEWLEKNNFHSGAQKIKKNDEPAYSIDEYRSYSRSFDKFKSYLDDNICEKIVLSRKKTINKKDTFSLGVTFKNACKTYPESMVCLFKTIHTGTWLTITPEIIISGKGEDWQTVSLAGTRIENSPDNDIDWDNKNINEQEIVTSFIQKKLLEKEITFTMKGPFTVKAGKLRHLMTEFKMNLHFSSLLSDLLFALHPTPAVCGLPKDVAMKIIKNNEDHDRRYYCGFCGPVSKTGETSLYVNLRCMEISDKLLTLYAGGGLIIDSEKENEWEETEAKFNTMLSIIDN
jgi:isochorismate synthase